MEYFPGDICGIALAWISNGNESVDATQ